MNKKSIVNELNLIAENEICILGSQRIIASQFDHHGFNISNIEDEVSNKTFQVDSLYDVAEILSLFYDNGKSTEQVFSELNENKSLKLKKGEPIFLHYLKQL